jgi:hypothetical protein
MIKKFSEMFKKGDKEVKKPYKVKGGKLEFSTEKSFWH